MLLFNLAKTFAAGIASGANVSVQIWKLAVCLSDKRFHKAVDNALVEFHNHFDHSAAPKNWMAGTRLKIDYVAAALRKAYLEEYGTEQTKRPSPSTPPSVSRQSGSFSKKQKQLNPFPNKKKARRGGQSHVEVGVRQDQQSPASQRGQREVAPAQLEIDDECDEEIDLQDPEKHLHENHAADHSQHETTRICALNTQKSTSTTAIQQSTSSTSSPRRIPNLVPKVYQFSPLEVFRREARTMIRWWLHWIFFMGFCDRFQHRLAKFLIPADVPAFAKGFINSQLLVVMGKDFHSQFIQDNADRPIEV